MLPAESPGAASVPPDPTDEGVRPSRPELTLVSSAAETSEDVPFETGLLRSAILGGMLGFSIIFVLVLVGFLLAGIDPAATVLSAIFVASFGGVGFGAMEAASMHKPPKKSG